MNTVENQSVLVARPERAAVLFLLLTLAGCFLPLDFAHDNFLLQRVADAFHYVLFAVLTAFLAVGLRPRMKTALTAIALAVSLTAGVATAIEVIQPYFGRSESSVDLENGLLGAAAAALGCLVIARRNRALTGAWVVVFLLGQIAVLIPAAAEWKAQRYRAANFPLVAGFEHRLDEQFWSPVSDELTVERLTRTGARPWVTSAALGGYSLRVDTVQNHYSGAELRLGGMSWAGARTLRFYAGVSTPQQLLVRIDDDSESSLRFSSRYNGAFTLHAGWNEIEIPLLAIEQGPADRRLNLSRLKRAIFFLESPAAGTALFLDELRLN